MKETPLYYLLLLLLLSNSVFSQKLDTVDQYFCQCVSWEKQGIVDDCANNGAFFRRGAQKGIWHHQGAQMFLKRGIYTSTTFINQDSFSPLIEAKTANIIATKHLLYSYIQYGSYASHKYKRLFDAEGNRVDLKEGLVKIPQTPVYYEFDCLIERSSSSWVNPKMMDTVHQTVYFSEQTEILMGQQLWKLNDLNYWMGFGLENQKVDQQLSWIIKKVRPLKIKKLKPKKWVFQKRRLRHRGLYLKIEAYQYLEEQKQDMVALKIKYKGRLICKNLFFVEGSQFSIGPNTLEVLEVEEGKLIIALNP